MSQTHARTRTQYLVTGNAGFIGFHTAKALLERGHAVVGVDSVNSYYDASLKEARLAELERVAGTTGGTYRFVRLDLIDRAALGRVFETTTFDRVIHLAAQAGVRYSMANPHAYTEANVTGFLNILEECRRHSVRHLVYASTSSVYGANRRMPFSEHTSVDHPLTLYAVTKRANELMAHAYSTLFGLPTTGLRFFTVYGPWGRPDMALFIFTKNILEGRPIPLFNGGNHARDFTYVDDVVQGVLKAAESIAQPDPAWSGEHPDPATSSAPFRIFNVGNSKPVKLTDYVAALEAALGRKARVELMPMQPGDVPDTFADISELADLGYVPGTPVEIGVGRFVEWYRRFYGV